MSWRVAEIHEGVEFALWALGAWGFAVLEVPIVVDFSMGDADRVSTTTGVELVGLGLVTGCLLYSTDCLGRGL